MEEKKPLTVFIGGIKIGRANIDIPSAPDLAQNMQVPKLPEKQTVVNGQGKLAEQYLFSGETSFAIEHINPEQLKAAFGGKIVDGKWIAPE